MTPTTTSADARALPKLTLEWLDEEIEFREMMDDEDDVRSVTHLRRIREALATPPAVDAPGAVEALRREIEVAAVNVIYERAMAGSESQITSAAREIAQRTNLDALARPQAAQTDEQGRPLTYWGGRPQAAQGREDCSHENMQASFAESRWVCRDCGRNFASWSDAMQERTTPPKTEGAEAVAWVHDALARCEQLARHCARKDDLLGASKADGLAAMIARNCAPDMRPHAVAARTTPTAAQASDTGRGEAEVERIAKALFDSEQANRNGGWQFSECSLIEREGWMDLAKAAIHAATHTPTEDRAGKDGEVRDVR